MLKSQAESLRRTIKYIEEKFGKDALILPDLRVQLSSTEKAERPLSECAPNPITLDDRGE